MALSDISCCCYLFILPIIFLFQGIIIVVPVSLFAVIGCISVALFWILPDILFTLLTIWLTPRWGPNVKIMISLMTPIAVVLWLPLVFVCSLVAGMLYGLFGPMVHGFVGFCNTNHSDIYAWCGGHIFKIIKNTRDFLIDFWDMNGSYKSMLYDFRSTANADGSVFEISLLKIPIGFIIVVVAGVFNTISLLVMSIIMYVPLTYQLFKKFLGIVCCCDSNDGCGDDDMGWCRCIAFICFVPISVVSILIPFAGPIILILCPFYGFWYAIRAALYACNNNKFVLSYYYTKEFNLDSWYTLTNFVFDLDKNYDTPHMDGNAIVIPIVNPAPIFPHIVPESNDVAHKSHVVPPGPVSTVSLAEIWDSFFKVCEEYIKEAVKEKLVSVDDIESMEPYLFIGLPSFVVFRMIERSLQYEGTIFLMANNTFVIEENRPKNFLANTIWPILVNLRTELMKLKPSSDEIKYMEASLITLKNENKMKQFQEISKERIKEINVVTSKFQSLGTTISRLPQVPRRFGNTLRSAICADV
jgi:hypothetical protein